MADYASNILDAVSILVDQAVAAAGYNKTVQATVVSCVDASIGKYKVKYQDSYWYAFNNAPNTTYNTGMNVYVLIPNGDMGQDKIILGTVDKLGTNYINVIEQGSQYANIGSNLIKEHDELSMCSYYAETKEIYNVQNNQNILNLNIDAINEYLKQSNYIKVNVDLKTTLPYEQQYRGDYGLEFELLFQDNATGEQVVRTYIFNTDLFTGNPYRFEDFTTNTVVFPVDGKNFMQINKISLFAKDFPIQETRTYPEDFDQLIVVDDDEEEEEIINPANTTRANDIFFANIELFGAQLLTTKQQEGVYINLLTPRGLIFEQNTSSTPPITIEAEVRVKMQPIDLNSQQVDFYWFVENNNITNRNQWYNPYGGQGWFCLNEYTIVDGTVQGETEETEVIVPSVVTYTPTNNTLNIQSGDVLAHRVRYKCVAIYGGVAYAKEFTVINKVARYSVTLTSDLGTDFSYDVGEPTLTCRVIDGNDNNTDSNFTYQWSRINNVGNFESLTSNIEDHPEQYKVSVKKINNFNIFKCSVFGADSSSGQFLIGSAQIKIVNSLTAEGTYSLVINNGTQVFNYNEAGIAPNSQSLENPYVIPALNFTIFDEKGNALDPAVNEKCIIKWTIPKNNTMITVENAIEQDDQLVVYNEKTLTYQIDQRYSMSKVNNNIKLEVRYNGSILFAQTNFTFLKQGQNGTNGTDCQIRIVPAGQASNVPYFYTVFINEADGAITKNWDTRIESEGTTSHEIWFQIELWENGERIFHSNQSGQGVSVRWSLLLNKYPNNIGTVLDYSCLQLINPQTCEVSYNPAYLKKHPNNIIKVQVTYKNLQYYATVPICTITTSHKADFIADIKDFTGFKYVMYQNDGTRPAYDDHAPLEIIFKNPYWYYEPFNIQDLINAGGTISYNWSCEGRYYQYKKNVSEQACWIQEQNLQIVSGEDNYRVIRPVDKYDGFVKNNAIIVILEGTLPNGEADTFGYIHIPIHLYLNRYNHSDINAWDGNSIELGGNNNGIILAPQVGAGTKNSSDNTFTGMIMGKVYNDASNPYQRDIGLFGYNHGERTIFLDAETGKATFGKTGNGQIIFDPTEGSTGTAKIYGGNYIASQGTTAGSGMLIDLTTPEIKFGSGNFSVGADGKLIAKQVTISGAIRANSLITGNRATIQDPTSPALGTYIDSQGNIYSGIRSVTNDGISSTANAFTLSKQGQIYAYGAQLENATITNGSIRINTNNGNYSYIRLSYTNKNYYDGTIIMNPSSINIYWQDLVDGQFADVRMSNIGFQVSKRSNNVAPRSWLGASDLQFFRTEYTSDSGVSTRQAAFGNHGVDLYNDKARRVGSFQYNPLGPLVHLMVGRESTQGMITLQNSQNGSVQIQVESAASNKDSYLWIPCQSGTFALQHKTLSISGGTLSGTTYINVPGTTTATASSYLILGNNTSTGTVGNSRGCVRIYGTKTGYTNLWSAVEDTSKDVFLPNGGGTIMLNTGGTFSGTVTINTPSTGTEQANSYLYLGNNKANGTAGSSRGGIVIYGNSTSYTALYSNVTTSAHAVYFPDKGGTLAMTSDLTPANIGALALSGGTMSGDIKMGSKTTIANTGNIGIYKASGNPTLICHRSDDNASPGRIMLYAANGKYVNLFPNASMTNDKSITLPATEGTLALVSDIPAATAVKGNAESSYRTGNVNLTPANIGALALSGGTTTGNVGITNASGDQRLALGTSSSYAHKGALRVYGTGGKYTDIVAYNTGVGPTSSITISLPATGGLLALQSSSARRYKTNISYIIDSLFDPHKLLNLPMAQFKYREDANIQYLDMRNLLIDGFIAEDVNTHYPAAVIHNANGEIQSWDERRILPPMLALIQELYQEKENLNNEITTLKNQIAEILNRL